MGPVKVPGTKHPFWLTIFLEIWMKKICQLLENRHDLRRSVWETFFFSYLAILASWFKIVLAKLELHLPSLAIRPWLENYDFLTLTFLHKVHPNPILFDIIKFYSTESVFKIIWIVCIELWEVYILYITK